VGNLDKHSRLDKHSQALSGALKRECERSYRLQNQTNKKTGGLCRPFALLSWQGCKATHALLPQTFCGAFGWQLESFFPTSPTFALYRLYFSCQTQRSAFLIFFATPSCSAPKRTLKNGVRGSAVLEPPPKGTTTGSFCACWDFNAGFFRSEGGTVKAARLPKGWTGPVSMLGTRGGIKPAPCYFAHTLRNPHTTANRSTRQTQHNRLDTDPLTHSRFHCLFHFARSR
jgi:hypothetical protein